MSDDAFGLGKAKGSTFVANAGQFAFLSDKDKSVAFTKWLHEQFDQGLLEQVDGPTGPVPWTAQYVRPAYRKAITDAQLAAAPPGQDPFESAAWLQQAFQGPIATQKLARLYLRQFQALQGITAAMDAQLNRTLASAVGQGLGVRDTAKALVKDVDGFTKKRAVAFAHTELIHTYAEGQLDGLEAQGVSTVELAVEWSTAGDHKVCPKCQAEQGKVYTIKGARGLIPKHPRCRCAWIPAAPKTLGKAIGAGKDYLQAVKTERQALIDAATVAKAAATAHSLKTKLGMAKGFMKKKMGVAEDAIIELPSGVTTATPQAIDQALATKGWTRKAVGVWHPKTGAKLDGDLLSQKDAIVGLGKPSKQAQAWMDTVAEVEPILGEQPHFVMGKDGFNGAALAKIVNSLGTGEGHGAIWQAAKAVKGAPAQLAKVKALVAEQTEKLHAKAVAQGVKAMALPGSDVDALDVADYSPLGWQAKGNQSYGMVLINDEGKVLLRKSKDNFGGAGWTFAKGGGKSPASTALKELGEETGYKAKIVGGIEGDFPGTTTNTNYFVGVADGFDAALMDKETEAVQWVTVKQAREMIKAESTEAVAARDIAVLESLINKDFAGDSWTEVVADGVAKSAAKLAADKAAQAAAIKAAADAKLAAAQAALLA